jgi:hypothetical protein
VTLKRLTSLLLSFFLVGLALLIYFINVGEDASRDVKDSIAVEIVKALLQFLIVIVIIGGVITALLKAFDERREESRLRTNTRQEYLNRLGQVYRKVKVARRALGAAGLTTRYENTPGTLTSDQVDLYIKEMTQLEATQLDLEGLKIEAKSLPTFLDVDPRLDDRLRAMEQHLRDILWEFEEASATVKVEASFVCRSLPSQ